MGVAGIRVLVGSRVEVGVKISVAVNCGVEVKGSGLLGVIVWETGVGSGSCASD